MARIRTIKPEFFRHEELYQAEKESGLPLRVAFAGLFTVADREGRFKWKPTQIKFDVLPYDNVDFSEVLTYLADFGFILKYEVSGKTYGCIPSFKDHQVINNKEAKSLLPPPPDVNQRDFHASFTRGQRVLDGREGKEGKGREHIKPVCDAVAEIFGRAYESNPEERMPELSAWHKEVETQAEKIQSVYGTEKAVRQIVAYVSHCKLQDRKLIGTVWKVAKTILEADWIALATPPPIARGDPFAEAAFNKSLWTEEAWRDRYKKQIASDEAFRKHFQITQ